jgi:hypothetical protein
MYELDGESSVRRAFGAVSAIDRVGFWPASPDATPVTKSNLFIEEDEGKRIRLIWVWPYLFNEMKTVG